MRARARPTPRHGDLPVPAYDYHCDACGSTYELREGFDAETTHPCEAVWRARPNACSPRLASCSRARAGT